MTRKVMTRIRHNKNMKTDKQIVSDYIKGKYESDINAYSRDFSMAHKTVDLYELATGRKLSCKENVKNLL